MASSETPNETEEERVQSHWQKQRIEEQRAVIDETLACGTTCGLVESLDPSMMRTDLATGVYNPQRDPAYTLSPAEMNDKSIILSPRQRSPRQERGYMEVATEDQRAMFKAAWRGRDPFALYTFHRHLHEHQQARRSFLQVCRDEDEVRQYWKWVSKLDAHIPHEQPNIANDEVDKRCGWPFNDHAIDRRVEAWRSRAADRATRLNEVRERWKNIMRERVEERRQLFSRKRERGDDQESKEGEDRLQRSLERLRRKRLGNVENEKPKISLRLRLLPRDEDWGTTSGFIECSKEDGPSRQPG
ncbi:predicted protein [Uncinocarpus reesii 1704]|uniref:Uncharacterized protein n=1 Tax=Uncinocarpus reesii (strain UAMH 1704) TaxID=336963 RepID=C4JLS0_UNCRE|nr:uncharacterized protein UREG_03778 [Uncinocarpus reesii 1704]EEP78932.1 predicted protein [Uncinocarpus reesii 1704]